MADALAEALDIKPPALQRSNRKCGQETAVPDILPLLLQVHPGYSTRSICERRSCSLGAERSVMIVFRCSGESVADRAFSRV
ncbi:hypothetical protein ROHU_016173 [Labeo rohita]|uniref:Uncharacterized protein n=1 Tax=Labeo rohita TaxID=84645 RepID=A0A498NLE3_LABRO|nr:hypothetical protein ROHU_016173 [Labeo rohita]